MDVLLKKFGMTFDELASAIELSGRDQILKLTERLIGSTKWEAGVQGATPPKLSQVFPPSRTSTVGHVNGLLRTNYFNGRFLTADDLRAEQVYWDLRARMDVQMHPPGIAWGLALDVPKEVVVVEAASGPVRHASLCSQVAEGTLDYDKFVKRLKELGIENAEFYNQICGVCQWGEADREGWRKKYNISREVLEEICSGRTVQPPTRRESRVSFAAQWTLRPGLAFDGIGRPISVGADYRFDVADLIQRYRTRPTAIVPGGTQFAPCVCIDDTPPAGEEPGAALGPGPYLLLLSPTEEGQGKAKVYGTACNNGKSADVCEVDGWRGGFELQLSRLPVNPPGEVERRAFRGILSAWYFDVYEHNLTRRWERTRATAETFPLDVALWRGPGPDRLHRSAVPLALVYLGADNTVEWVDQWIPRRPIAGAGAAAWAANVRGAPGASARIARVHQFQEQLIDSLEIEPDIKRGGNLHDRGFRHLPPWGFLPVSVTEGRGRTLTEAALERVLAPGKKGVTSAEVFAAASAFFRGTNVVVLPAYALHEDEIFEDMVRADEKDPILLQESAVSRYFADGRADDSIVQLLLPQFYKLLRAGVDHSIEVVRVVALLDAGVRVHPELTGMPGVARRQDLLDRDETHIVADARSRLLNQAVGLSARPWAFYVKQRIELPKLLLGVAQRLAPVLAKLVKPAEQGTKVAEKPVKVKVVEMRKWIKSDPLFPAVGANIEVIAGGLAGMAKELASTASDLRSKAYWAQYRELVKRLRDDGEPREASDRALDALSVRWSDTEPLKMAALVMAPDRFDALVDILEQGAETEDVPIGVDAFESVDVTTASSVEVADLTRDLLAERTITDPGGEAVRVGDVLTMNRAAARARFGDASAMLEREAIKSSQAALKGSSTLARAAAVPAVAEVLRKVAAGELKLDEADEKLKAIRGAADAAKALKLVRDVLGEDGAGQLVARLPGGT